MLITLGIRYHYNIYNHMNTFIGSTLIMVGYILLLKNNQYYFYKNFIYQVVGIKSESTEFFEEDHHTFNFWEPII